MTKQEEKFLKDSIEQIENETEDYEMSDDDKLDYTTDVLIDMPNSDFRKFIKSMKLIRKAKELRGSMNARR